MITARFSSARCYLEWLVAVGICLLLFYSSWFLIGRSKLVPLIHKLFLELLLGLSFQQLLPEGDVREHGGKCATQFHGCLRTFLAAKMGG